MTETRDDELGAALRALPVPPPPAGFYDDLRTNLAPTKTRRHTGWLVPLTAAAAVAAVVLGAGALRSSLTADKPTPPATHGPSADPEGQRIADEMRAAMVQTAAVRVSGTWETTSNGETDTLTFSASRSEGIETAGYTNTAGETFGSKTYGYGTVSSNASGTSVVESGLAFTRPDPNGVNESRRFLMTDLLSYVRAELAAGRATEVSETNVGGRPAWRVKVITDPNRVGGSGGDTARVVIDRATGAALAVVESLAGVQVSRYTVNDIGTQVLNTMEGKLGNTDRGWRHGTLEQAEAAVEYRVPAVSGLPVDLEPAGAAWVVHSDQPTGAEGMNPVTERAVQQRFARGLAEVVVTTRVQNPDRHSPADCDGCDHGWQDPLHPGEGYQSTPEDVVLTDGDFAGITAHVVIHSRATPHIWLVRENGLVVTIGGDLTRDELVAAANSLHASTAPVS